MVLVNSSHIISHSCFLIVSASGGKFFSKDGEGGHSYYVGTLKDLFRVDPSDLAAACEDVRSVAVGPGNNVKLFELQNLMLSFDDKVRIPGGAGRARCLHATVDARYVEDESRYKLAYGGSGSDVLFFQVPSITFGERLRVFDVAAKVQAKTGVQSDGRRDGYAALTSSLSHEESRVYAFRTPYAVHNGILQDGSKDVPDGRFSAIKVFAPHERFEGGSWPGRGYHLTLAWEIPILDDVKKDEVGSEEGDSDDEWAAYQVETKEKAAEVEEMKEKQPNSPEKEGVFI